MWRNVHLVDVVDLSEEGFIEIFFLFKVRWNNTKMKNTDAYSKKSVTDTNVLLETIVNTFFLIQKYLRIDKLSFLLSYAKESSTPCC